MILRRTFCFFGKYSPFSICNIFFFPYAINNKKGLIF